MQAVLLYCIHTYYTRRHMPCAHFLCAAAIGGATLGYTAAAMGGAMLLPPYSHSAPDPGPDPDSDPDSDSAPCPESESSA